MSFQTDTTLSGGGIFIIATTVDIVMSKDSGHPVILCTGYLSPFIVLFSSFVFILVKELVKSQSINMVIQLLSANAFGIYLTHVFFIEGLMKLHYLPIIGDRVWFAPFYLLVLLVLCLGFTVLLKKIPFFNYIFK